MWYYLSQGNCLSWHCITIRWLTEEMTLMVALCQLREIFSLETDTLTIFMWEQKSYICALCTSSPIEICSMYSIYIHARILIQSYYYMYPCPCMHDFVYWLPVPILVLLTADVGLNKWLFLIRKRTWLQVSGWLSWTQFIFCCCSICCWYWHNQCGISNIHWVHNFWFFANECS